MYDNQHLFVAEILKLFALHKSKTDAKFFIQ